MNNKGRAPQRIVCLTEESVEFLHAIGRSDLIVGVSVFAKRPKEVEGHPIISSFTHAHLEKIKNLNPDLVIGFSDIQKDIARNLIGEGINVFISNQRSLQEIFNYLWMLGQIVNEEDKTKTYLDGFEKKMIEAKDFAATLKARPLVYLEEWDEPQICGIQWFSEIVELCGGNDIFRDKSHLGKMAKDRFVSDEEVLELNPDIILASWCGKPVEMNSFYKRDKTKLTKAVLNDQVYELPPEIFLQPGPALFVDGIDQLIQIFKKWA